MDGRALIIDDDPDMCRFLAASLLRSGLSSEACNSAEQGLRTLERRNFDIVLSDVQMPNMDGIQLCERIVRRDRDLPVVVVTAHANLENALAALRAGAFDFLTKPLDVELLHNIVRRALRRRRAVGEPRVAPGADAPEVELVGDSPSMVAIRQSLERMAGADCPILITGESGTGKEVVARWLHVHGHRRGGPFVAINCAAIPKALLESELFGHVRGAFTDAKSDHAGLFEQADGGTVFLDEIGEMPIDLQPKLLRALEQRAIRPVGGTKSIRFDARVITATNAKLEEMVATGRFRADLYYRIEVLGVSLPPLRARGGDVLLLADRFAKRFAQRMGKAIKGISPEASERLLAYGWPGNVRELCNCIERAVILTRHDVVTVEDLPVRLLSSARDRSWVDVGTPLTLYEVERRHILHVMEIVEGNKCRAARILAVDRKTLARKLEQYAARERAALASPAEARLQTRRDD